MMRLETLLSSFHRGHACSPQCANLHSLAPASSDGTAGSVAVSSIEWSCRKRIAESAASSHRSEAFVVAREDWMPRHTPMEQMITLSLTGCLGRGK